MCVGVRMTVKTAQNEDETKEFSYYKINTEEQCVLKRKSTDQ